MAKKSALAENLIVVRDKIAAACAKAGRDASEVTLVAVTKYAAPEQVREIIQLGIGDLGESRVQSLQQRAATINEFFHRQQGRAEALDMPARLRWHMIGHLQRNKVKQILPLVDLIHSVDSLRLAEELDTAATKLGKRIAVMLQVNASEEESKFGVAVGAAVHLAEQMDTMPGLQVVGLMTMAPMGAKPAETRSVFTRTREIFEEMRWHKIGGNHLRHLSMGMSGDYEQAILEGATMVRIGSALFGGGGHDHEQADDGPDIEVQVRRKVLDREPEEEPEEK